MIDFLQSIKNYVRFSNADAERLLLLLEHARPYFHGFVDNFYDRIVQHPEAERVLDGPAQVARLKMTLIKWMRSGLKGPHDQAYYERRTRIGRMHVIIGLPQQFMVTAMNVLRLDFHAMLEEVYADDPAQARDTRNSVDKLFDLELAIMLRTYQSDSEERLRRHVRLTTSSQVTARIGSELEQPLAAIRAAAMRLEDRMHTLTEDDSVALRSILAQADACEEIVSELSQLGQDEVVYLRRVDVLGLIGRAQASVDLGASVQVELSCDAGLTMRADPDLLEHAVRELMSLGVRISHGLAAVLRVSAHEDDAGFVVIEVATQGGCISPDGDRRTGYGSERFQLERAIAMDIADRHGGRFETVETAAGAVLRLLLPRVPAQE